MREGEARAGVAAGAGADAGVVVLTDLPPGGGLELILDWRRGHKSHGRAPFIVVPSRRDALALTQRLAQEEGVLLGESAVGTFDDLVRAVLGRACKEAAPLERELALLEAGAGLWGSEDSVLGRLPHALAGLVDLLEELEESALEDDEIEAALVAWEGGTAWPAAAKVARELRVLRPAYLAVCAERGVQSRSRLVRDAARVAKCAVAGAGAGPAAAGGGRAAVRLHGGVAWQRPLACCGFLSFTPAQQALLASLGAHVPVLVGSAWRDEIRPRFLTAEMERWLGLGAQLVGCAQGAWGGGEVERRLVRSSGRRGEIEMVVSEAVQLLRQGVPLSEMALVVRSAGPWWRVAREVCDTWGVPLTIEASLRCAETRLGSRVLRGLREATAGRPLTLAGDPRYRDCVQEVGGEVFLRPAAVVDLVRQELERTVRVDSGGDVRAAALDARTAEVIIEAMDSLSVRGSASSSALTAVAVVDRLAEMQVWSSIEPREGLTLLGAGRMRLRRPRVVFVLGLVDQEFPAASGSTGLLPDHFRRDCNRCSGVRLLGEGAEDRDALLFHTAVGAATEVVYLSQRLADDDGGPLTPSPFLTAELGGPSPPRLWRTRTLADVVFSPEEAPSLREFQRWCAATGSMPEGTELASWPPLHARIAPRRRGLHHPRCISLLSQRGSHTAGEIETYARCPMAWFLERVVGIEMPSEAGDPRELGVLIHNVLARLYTNLRHDGALPLREETLPSTFDRVERLLGEGTAHLSEGGSAADVVILREQARQRVCEFLRREAAQQGHLIPTYLEYSLPADGVDLGGGLSVRGRVDRIDVAPDGEQCAVFDYKSGSYSPPRDWAGSGTLQVPLYMLAFQRLHPEMRLIGGGYLVLGSGTAAGFVAREAAEVLGTDTSLRPVEAQELSSLLEACRLAAAQAAEGMRAGRIPYRADGPCPEFCRLGPVCRRPFGVSEGE